jgi:hypothetical protein
MKLDLAHNAAAQIRASYQLSPDGLVTCSYTLLSWTACGLEVAQSPYQPHTLDPLAVLYAWPPARRQALAVFLREPIEEFEALAARTTRDLVAQAGESMTANLTVEMGSGSGNARQVEIEVCSTGDFSLRAWTTSVPGDPYILDPMPPTARKNNPRFAGKTDWAELLEQIYDEPMAVFVRDWTAELRQVQADL